jgi:hypothetical protein
MQIYFCGAIMGGRDHLPAYRHIVGHLLSRGHIVPTVHVADPEVLNRESALSAREVFQRDEAWIRQADAMIAEISTPSLGVGYEIARGLQRGIPVLCLYRSDLTVSKMISGNTSPHLEVKTYDSPDELALLMDRFLAACG